jgi:ABC-type nitrate/sulfonate/bicarbonate transport system ATPase subunit
VCGVLFEMLVRKNLTCMMITHNNTKQCGLSERVCWYKGHLLGYVTVD